MQEEVWGANLGCRGRFGVQREIWGAGGEPGCKTGVQGEIWGADLGLKVQEEIWGANLGCRGTFGVQTWDLACRRSSGVQEEIWGADLGLGEGVGRGSISGGLAVPRGRVWPQPRCHLQTGSPRATGQFH